MCDLQKKERPFENLSLDTSKPIILKLTDPIILFLLLDSLEIVRLIVCNQCFFLLFKE